jgi:hypothetical protein
MNEITMETMNPREIKTHESFKALFPIRPELLATIEEGMKTWEYDESQPIIVGTWEGQCEPVCIDGHTRLQAAKNTGITEVPVSEQAYTSEEAAIEHAIMLQCHRRNLSDAELLHFIDILDTRSVPQRNENGKFAGAPNGAAGKSAEATGKLLGISGRKVERSRTIIDHGDSEIVGAVKNGEMSVNQGYEKTQKKRKAVKEAADTASDSSAEAHAPVEEETTVRSEDTRAEDVDNMAVTLTHEHYRALKELDGSIQYHVDLAIDLYLLSLGNFHADKDTCADIEEYESEYDDGCED